MASSLELPKKPTRKPAAKKAARQGTPEGIVMLLGDYSFDEVRRDQQQLELEVRVSRGRMIIYRTRETPKGSKEEIGRHGLTGIPDPVEFVILDTDEKWVEKDIAETVGRAEEYGRAFAAKRNLEFADLRGRRYAS